MTEGKPPPRIKAALVAFPERYILPSKPATASPVVQDAYRQTQFLLGNDLGLFERAMNLQLAIVAANAKARTPAAAAIFSFWSQTYSYLADAATIMSLGSYSSCPPLARAALDCVAVQRAVIRDGFGDYEEWFEGAISQDKAHAALRFDLGRYRAGSVLAEDERLGTLYRLLMDLSMPHFGSTAFHAGADSSLQKLALGFGDQAFHLAWAELVTAWLLTMCDVQLQTVAAAGVLTVSATARTAVADTNRDIAEALGSKRRCYVEEADGRFLFQNFRRKPGGVPRRVVL